MVVIKEKIVSYLMYLDANNLYGWVMSQKLSVDGFKCVKDFFRFNECSSSEIFIKIYDENSNKGYFVEVNVEYLKNFLTFINIFHFYLKEKKSINVKSLFVV